MQHAGNNNEVPHRVVCRAINFKLRQLSFVHRQEYGNKDFGGCSAALDAAWCRLRRKSRAKLRHHCALRTGEEALRSTRVLHQCIVVPEKPLFLKREGLTFCFNTNWHMRDSHQNKGLQHSNKCCFLSGPPWSLLCYPSDSIEPGGGGGEEQGIHILRMSSFPSSSTTKSSPVLNWTQYKQQQKTSLAISICMAFLCRHALLSFVYCIFSTQAHWLPTESGSLALQRWEMRRGSLPYMNINYSIWSTYASEPKLILSQFMSLTG